jgi:hypothetical protein
MVALGKNWARWGPLAGVRAKFEQMRPEIEVQARHAFQNVSPGLLDALVDEVTEHAFHVYVSLAQRGKADIAYPKPLAISAIKQVSTARHLPAEDHSKASQDRFRT